MGLVGRVDTELQTVTGLMEFVGKEERRLRQELPTTDRLTNDGVAAEAARTRQATLDEVPLLRRGAYGRVVRLVDVENEAERVVRVAWGGLGWPAGSVFSRGSGIVSQVVTARVGDTVELPFRGEMREYEVVEVSLLRRFEILHGHEDDFAHLRMVGGEADGAEVQELRDWLARAGQEILEFDDEGEEVLPAPLDAESRAQLGDTFFMDPLPEQEEAMKWPSRGLVVVTGVAGSGKTSVALGRTRMLCMYDEERPEDLPHRPENGLGVVLNDQLVGYLKKALEGNLNLAQMPVRSYTNIRQVLIRDRDVIRQGVTRFSPNASVDPVVGSGAYFDALERSLTVCILREMVRRVGASPPPLDGAVFARVGDRHRRALAGPWSVLHQGLQQRLQFAEKNPEKMARADRLVVGVDELREVFARTLEKLEPWDSPNFKDARKAVRDDLRRRFEAAFAYGERYLDVIGDAKTRAALLREASPSESLHALDGDLARRSSARALSDSDIDCILLYADLAGRQYTGRNGAEPVARLREFDRRTHVFVDEFQDFTEVQLRLVMAMADPAHNAITAVGDFQQRLHPFGLDRMPMRPAHEAFLHRNKRQSAPLHALSAEYRSTIQGDHRQMSGEPVKPGDEAPFALAKPRQPVEEALARAIIRTRQTAPHLSMAVVCPDVRRAEELHRRLRDQLGEQNVLAAFSVVTEARVLSEAIYVHFTTSLPVKGLEFDAVFCVDVDRYDLTQPVQRDGLYVALTRARRRLGVSWDGALDGRLAEVFARRLGPVPEWARPG